jgi:hypothetical protein
MHIYICVRVQIIKIQHVQISIILSLCVIWVLVRGDLTVVRVHNQNALLYTRQEGHIKSAVSHFVVNEEIRREIN